MLVRRGRPGPSQPAAPPAGSLLLGVRALGAVKLVETDQVQREVLDSVEQAVEPGVIADCGDDAGAAVRRHPARLFTLVKSFSHLT